MTDTVRFERSHDIEIAVPPEMVFDYVSNPKSWPEWLAASHFIDSPDRPLRAGDTFSEKWHIRSGEVLLNWIVKECDRPRRWVAETETTFIGRIVAQYDVVPTAAGCRYTRTIVNPARPRAPTDDQIRRVDEEAAIGLGDIKRLLEARGR